MIDPPYQLCVCVCVCVGELSGSTRCSQSSLSTARLQRYNCKPLYTTPHPPFIHHPSISQTTQVILDGLANILSMAGTSVDIITIEIEEADGLEKIERLQNHKNQDIYRLAYKIIDKYFTQEVNNIIYTMFIFNTHTHTLYYTLGY